MKDETGRRAARAADEHRPRRDARLADRDRRTEPATADPMRAAGDRRKATADPAGELGRRASGGGVVKLAEANAAIQVHTA